MKRTTVSLPDELAAALDREAKRRGVPVSLIAREAIEERLGRTPRDGKKLPFEALGASGHTDTAERFEELLAESWADAIERDSFDRHR